MGDERPAKRARQACEPCRRKKSRCPGERPVCSCCRRLGQTCVYNSPEQHRLDLYTSTNSRQLESRMESLETKLDGLIEHLGSPQGRSSKSSRSVNDTVASIHQSQIAPTDVSDRPCTASESMPPGANESLLETGRLYITWCHNQPLALFNKSTFAESLQSRPRELRLAVEAMVLRFPPARLDVETQETVECKVRESRSLVMERMADETVDLSMMQTLCILSTIDFAHGKTVQAGFNLNTANYFAQRLPPGHYLDDPKECYDCIRAIMTLQMLQGPVLPKPDYLLSSAGLEGFSKSSEPAILIQLGADDISTRDIAWHSAQLAEVWQLARAYAASRVEGRQLPPWHPQSDYSTVMSHHFEFDSKVPLKYRFSKNNFNAHTLEVLNSRRDYWGPWLHMQIKYAAIQCLLNHPFLLSLRLKDFRYQIPQMFISQSFEQITRHAGWIMFFIGLVERKSFEISDPTLAHCVVIVATIHLQHSFVSDPAMQRKAQTGFEACIRFLLRMGAMWPNATLMANNLEKLQGSILLNPVPAGHRGHDEQPGHQWSIDAQLLWDLIVYEKAGREGAAADQSAFGTALGSISVPRVQETAEFDLVGSAGISGHKSVPKEIPFYAPEEGSKSPATGEEATGDNMRHVDVDGFTREGQFESLGIWNEHDNLFFQAHDFGRAIDNWLELDVDV